MTLEIHVNELVMVEDVFGHVSMAIRRLISWLKAEDTIEPQDPPTEKGDNKSPPDLGIGVSEAITTKEVLS